ncbi:hypothetical protein DSM02_933 [Leeuwenhoekiella polynyae]|uniref:Uncharacterized protein n=1 Tax=Leeuwenhoekiella polynyae TaxID=1550906 RepID=A0A4Q0PFX1_9FLAO|nr:hypothetical protein DSM02_933 [Leeuwenhoekiella polynyae]
MNKTQILIAVGSLFISASLINSFYVHLNDSISGFLMGTGIGLLFISLVKIRKSSKAKS